MPSYPRTLLAAVVTLAVPASGAAARIFHVAELTAPQIRALDR